MGSCSDSSVNASDPYVGEGSTLAAEVPWAWDSLAGALLVCPVARRVAGRLEVDVELGILERVCCERKGESGEIT